jgi:hypothetical protein
MRIGGTAKGMNDDDVDVGSVHDFAAIRFGGFSEDPDDVDIELDNRYLW